MFKGHFKLLRTGLNKWRDEKKMVRFLNLKQNKKQHIFEVDGKHKCLLNTDLWLPTVNLEFGSSRCVIILYIERNDKQ